MAGHKRVEGPFTLMHANMFYNLFLANRSSMEINFKYFVSFAASDVMVDIIISFPYKYPFLGFIECGLWFEKKKLVLLRKCISFFSYDGAPYCWNWTYWSNISTIDIAFILPVCIFTWSIYQSKIKVICSMSSPTTLILILFQVAQPSLCQVAQPIWSNWFWLDYRI